MSKKLVSNTNSNNKNSKQKAFDDVKDLAKKNMSLVVCLWMLAIAVIVPLYLKQGYVGVGDCKFEAYKIIMIVGVVLFTFSTVVYLLQLIGVKPEGKIKLEKTDYFVIAFYILAFLAAIVGGNFSSCIEGYTGWFMGLLSLLSFVVLYFICSRFGDFYKVIFSALLGVSFITYVLGILHRMMIDPLDTYWIGTDMEISNYYKNNFLSTLGQASWYSSFVCTILPLGIGIYLWSKNIYVRILSGIFTVVGFMTLVSQNSDSAYMALAGFMFVFFWFLIPSAKGVLKILELLLMFASATRLMNLCLLFHPNDVLELDKLSNYMIFGEKMWFIWALILFIYVLYHSFYSLKLEDIKDEKFVGNWGKTGNVIRLICLGFVIVCCIFAATILILSAKGSTSNLVVTLGQKIPYMSWSDDWGNGRGQTWDLSFKLFADMDIGHKLFGVGPDGYAPFAYNLYAERLEEMWGNRTLTNAHNEWLNSIISYGIVGGIAYIGIFVSSVTSFAKTQKENENVRGILVGMIACIVSYMCHNFFCYQTVCCTPFIFILMGLGCFICRKK